MCDLMLQVASKCCSNEEMMKKARGVLKFCAENSNRAKMQHERVRVFSVMVVVILGLLCAKMKLIYFCFKSTNPMLSWFSLNEVKMQIANFWS